MLRRTIRLVALGILMALLVPTMAGAQTNVTFKGTVSRSPAQALGANGRLVLQLFENANSVPVYQAPSVAVGGVAPPYNFTITVSSATFKANRTYTLRATLAEGTAVRSVGSVPVVNGGSTTLSITALPASGTLPITGGGDLLLLVGLLLAVIAGALLLWRELRLRWAPRLPA